MIKNIFANFFGFFWGVVSNFLFIPIYINLLGFENYSIITFTLLIISFISIIENGLSSTVSRELARSDISQQRKRKIFNSLESFYFVLIFVFCLILFLFSKTLAFNFIEPTSLNLDDASICIRIFSLEIMFNLIIRFYVGAFNGLEKQVKANFLIILWSIFRNGMVILVLYFFPELIYFFSFQLFVSTFFFLVFKTHIDKELINNSINFKIDFKILKPILGFTFGILLISIISSVSTLLDRILISNYFSIKDLAYYTLAVSISSSVYFLTKPISVAILPRFTKLVTSEALLELNSLFYLIFSFSVIIISTSMWSIFFYSYQILEIWTGNKLIAQNSSVFLKFLVIGYSISSLQHFFYDIVVANKNVKINNIIGVFTMIIVIPAYYLAIKYFGSIALAITFSLIQIIITIIYIFYVNKIYLNKNIAIKLFIVDIILPFIISFFLIYFSKIMFDFLEIKNNYVTLVFCVLTAFFTILLLLLIYGKLIDVKKILTLTIKNKIHG